jgi:hypothetical protein
VAIGANFGSGSSFLGVNSGASILIASFLAAPGSWACASVGAGGGTGAENVADEVDPNENIFVLAPFAAEPNPANPLPDVPNAPNELPVEAVLSTTVISIISSSSSSIGTLISRKGLGRAGECSENDGLCLGKPNIPLLAPFCAGLWLLTSTDNDGRPLLCLALDGGWGSSSRSMISMSSDSVEAGIVGSSTIGAGRRALGVVSLGEGAVNVSVGG